MTHVLKERPAHSPLGASSADRWMNCPGSVALIKRLQLPESDEPDYRKEGTAAHELAADCLTNGGDAWEKIGEKYHDVEITQAIAEAVQVYLDEVRSLSGPDTETFIEFGISSPIHPLFYGTVDCAITDGKKFLDIVDYKNGAGVLVDTEENSQLMYYAYGFISAKNLLDEVEVRLIIVQPNGYHPEGPVRFWRTTAGYIRNWAETVLVPAMIRTEFDSHLEVGDHCRFCPAKLICPVMKGLWGAMCQANPQVIPELTDESLGRDYQMLAAVNHYIKAFKDETFRRLNLGNKISGCKLVPKRADRVFKPGATELAHGTFGEEAFEPAKLKSPAMLEKLGVKAKEFVKEHAYAPQTGLTVAVDSDRRVAVPMQKTSEKFAAALEKLDG